MRSAPVSAPGGRSKPGAGMTGDRRSLNQLVVPRSVRPLDERVFVSAAFPTPSPSVCGGLLTMTATDRRTHDLPKAYTPADFEAAIYQRWLDADVFAPDGNGSTADPGQPPFVIMQPPPNITGSLHLGHAQRSAVEDLMVRRARMLGRAALFLPGLDHASIAAQFVLDKIIAAEGETRESLGRERYLERMWRFINETREGMLGQQRRLGGSVHWARLPVTIDEGSGKGGPGAVQRLFRDGPAYSTP